MNVSRDAKKNVRRYATDTMSEDMPERMSGHMPARMPEDMPEKCQKICQKDCQNNVSIHARKRVRLKCHGGDHSIQNDRTSFVGKRLQAPDLLSSTRRTMFVQKTDLSKTEFQDTELLSSTRHTSFVRKQFRHIELLL